MPEDRPIKILLIAPQHPDLPSIDAEVAAISSFHEVERVIGVVRDSDILRAIEKGEGTYDILWFATHGGPEGMLLSASTLSPEGVGQFVATSGAKLCVLNTCASEDVAFRIIAGGDADMVFSITADIKDEDALRFGSLFAGELAKTEDFEEAFKKAAGPSATKYRYLKAKQALRGLALQATTALERIQEKVENLTQSTYETKIDTKATREQFASIQVQFEGMRTQFDSVRMQFEGMRSQFESIRLQFQAEDRQEASKSPKQESASLFTPTFWALIVLAALVIGYFIFAAGGR